ncbi:MAG: hypothetical protein Q8K75_04375 [Chlamydiales bacterium]|nr:hypothetical protein [Chlamydiales bacterium]
MYFDPKLILSATDSTEKTSSLPQDQRAVPLSFPMQPFAPNPWGTPSPSLQNTVASNISGASVLAPNQRLCPPPVDSVQVLPPPSPSDFEILCASKTVTLQDLAFLDEDADQETDIFGFNQQACAPLGKKEEEYNQRLIDFEEVLTKNPGKTKFQISKKLAKKWECCIPTVDQMRALWEGEIETNSHIEKLLKKYDELGNGVGQRVTYAKKKIPKEITHLAELVNKPNITKREVKEQLVSLWNCERNTVDAVFRKWKKDTQEGAALVNQYTLLPRDRKTFPGVIVEGLTVADLPLPGDDEVLMFCQDLFPDDLATNRTSLSERNLLSIPGVFPAITKSKGTSNSRSLADKISDFDSLVDASQHKNQVIQGLMSLWGKCEVTVLTQFNRWRSMRDSADIQAAITRYDSLKHHVPATVPKVNMERFAILRRELDKPGMSKVGLHKLLEGAWGLKYTGVMYNIRNWRNHPDASIQEVMQKYEKLN